MRPIEFYLLVNRAFFPTTLDKWRDLLKITFLRSLRLDQVESFRGQWRCQVFVFKVGNNSSFFSVFQLAYGGPINLHAKSFLMFSLWFRSGCGATLFTNSVVVTVVPFLAVTIC